MTNNQQNNDSSAFNPKVSVIIPAYNVKEFIGECIESIINQKYKNLEIIIVNDGSTDGTAQVIDKYAALDERIVVVNKANGGLSSARNSGLDVMTGDYVSFIDGDDFVDDDLYSTLVNTINEHKGADLIQFGYNHYYGDISAYRKDRDLKTQVLNGHESLYKFVNGEVIQGIVCNKLFKKNIIENVRFFYGKHYEDGAFTLEVLFSVRKSIIIDNLFYHYRRNRVGSITNELKTNVFEEWDIIDNLKERYKNDPHLLNCINNYSVEHTLYLFVDILRRGGGDRKQEMLERTIEYTKTLRSTKLLCPFGVKYIRYKLFLWCPRLFIYINKLMTFVKSK